MGVLAPRLRMLDGVAQPTINYVLPAHAEGQRTHSTWTKIHTFIQSIHFRPDLWDPVQKALRTG